MITVYTGQGKGKTTSAVGEALLAYSEGKRVLMVQFLKGSTYSGELVGLNRLGIPLIQFGVGCRWSGMIRTGLKHCTGCGECFRENRNPDIALDLVQQALEYVSGQVGTNTYHMIILDEISHAINRGFLNLDQLRKLLSDESSRQVHWILTGRGMPEELEPLVDHWWDLNMLKHPFSQGVKSRRGIEY
ncbi:ATP:corrinoid adenosyltransferase [Desulfosporosinus orientis DSM 765]|uniref:ATP:corrinoid adenosyltransferase n=1 Tax=Desulfosporosinus orientis (strain ATCC 19365 / DSM 765 / NCIMB 8382 / VKM B-1628 / Singapore I) TaxID=768706 RepID=G7WDK9_DESOD|nr:cob(I)yrinic acid a,c-diamide adenosyltransferase [Desulfosporosinus orientis]AET68334.1 ATP:corrinoid adenosyltransferase [Desulfosporosinus orientis DSM 765]